jgi:hypothetical protein
MLQLRARRAQARQARPRGLGRPVEAAFPLERARARADRAARRPVRSDLVELPTDARRHPSLDSQAVEPATASVQPTPPPALVRSPSRLSEDAYGPPRPPPPARTASTSSVEVLQQASPIAPPREVLFALEQPVRKLPQPTRGVREFVPVSFEEEQAFIVRPDPGHSGKAALLNRPCRFAALHYHGFLAVLVRLWPQVAVLHEEMHPPTRRT